MARYYAWGYYSAAIRGEIPRLISEKRVLDWLRTRPAYDAVSNSEWWASSMAPLIVEYLERNCTRAGADADV